MLEKYIPKHVANALIKHVVAVTLFIPYYYSNSYNVYFQDFILATFFAVLFMITIFTSWKLDFRRNGALICVLSVILVAYNGFATYMNYKYLHWFGDQLNSTLAFLFFIVLLLIKDGHELIDDSVIKGTIHMIVITNILALMYRALDKYSYLVFFNDEIRQDTFPVHEKQYSWLYSFKCVYAFLLVLCVAFFVVYRKHFRNTLTYCLSQGLLLVALYVSTTYTSMVAALIIFGAQFADYWWKANWKFKCITLAIFSVVFGSVAKMLFIKISEDRPILTLNSRTYIWEAFARHIADNPHGVGAEFGPTLYTVTETFATNNAHNYFMNLMFRFSIPVGILGSLLIIVIMIFSFVRNFSFLTLGIWLAILIPLLMDHTLLTPEYPFFLFMIYCIFFRKPKEGVC